jgi:FAD/FMN-containing dehydrogenase
LHQGAAAHCQIVIPTDKDNPENLQVMYEQLSKVLANSGAFYSRPYGLWADIVYGGNAEHTEMTKKMKAIFDPANILNPGKLCF